MKPLLLLLILTTIPALAQTIDTIRPNPAAVTLRCIWFARDTASLSKFATGVYMLGLYDSDGAAIASTRFVRE